MKAKAAFSGFSVDDQAKAKDFYSGTLGLEVADEGGGLGMRIQLPGGGTAFVYSKPDHQPASYTCLNFEVDDIDAAVGELSGKGVKFEQYPDLTDDKGVARGKAKNQGPDIAWFKDPAGNVLAVLQN
jgi:catechol 2,3-dioxygenase-like lactoylglutathione lyase family enzyme